MGLGHIGSGGGVVGGQRRGSAAWEEETLAGLVCDKPTHQEA